MIIEMSLISFVKSIWLQSMLVMRMLKTQHPIAEETRRLARPTVLNDGVIIYVIAAMSQVQHFVSFCCLNLCSEF